MGGGNYAQPCGHSIGDQWTHYLAYDEGVDGAMAAVQKAVRLTHLHVETVLEMGSTTAFES